MLVLYINRQVEVARSMSRRSDAPEAEEDSLKGWAPKIERRSGRHLSGDRVKNPVTVIQPDGELLKAKSTKATLRGLTGICQSSFFAHNT